MRTLLFACALVLALLGGCHRDGHARKSVRIAVIPKGTTHEFWKSVHAGAVKASRELGVDIVWKGPLKEDDLKAQIDLVQSFTAQAVAGICLAPLSDKGLVGAVEQARAAGIPVVVFDSDLGERRHVSFVATDNFAAGRIAGEQMARLLGGKGNVILLRYQEGSASTAHRESGFLDALGKSPLTRIVSSNQYGGATTESALAASENVLAANRVTQVGDFGVFCPNESTTFGMLLALQKAGLAGKVKLIGFDSSPKLLEGLRRGEIHGLVVQNPFKMGYLALRTMALHLGGESVQERIDTGAKLVTLESLDDPDVQALLSPDLERWLGK